MNEGRTGIGQGTPMNPSSLQPGRISSPPLSPQPIHPQPIHPQPIHGQPIPGQGIRSTPAMMPNRAVVDDSPLALDGDDHTTSTAEPPKSKIHNITAANSIAAHKYTRTTHQNKTGAVRLRTFHCRLSEQGVDYLDQLVNDWLEAHPEVEVKFTNSTIGLWDGKLKEPTLILNVWY